MSELDGCGRCNNRGLPLPGGCPVCFRYTTEFACLETPTTDGDIARMCRDLYARYAKAMGADQPERQACEAVRECVVMDGGITINGTRITTALFLQPRDGYTGSKSVPYVERSAYDALREKVERYERALKEIALGDGTYGAQAKEYKQVAREALRGEK